MTIGLWGEGEAAVWGPSFTFDPDAPSAPPGELVDAAIAYLDR